MKKILWMSFVLLLLLAGQAWPQAIPTTNRLSLYTPLYGSVNWNVPFNANMQILDSLCVTSDSTSSATGGIVVFSDTSGRKLKSYTGTGIPLLTSGGVGLAVPGTNYAPATTGTGILKGNGAGGFTAATSADFPSANSDGWNLSSATWAYGTTDATVATYDVTVNQDMSSHISPGTIVRVVNEVAYTNDPAAGSNIVLNVANTEPFTAYYGVTVSSSAGSEISYTASKVTNTSLTIAALALNHTTTNPLVSISQYFVVLHVGAYSGGAQTIKLFAGNYPFIFPATAPTRVYYANASVYGGGISGKTWWQLGATSTASLAQASPTDETWYAPTGTITLTLPRGDWRLGYTASICAYKSAAAILLPQATIFADATENASFRGGAIGYSTWVGGQVTQTAIVSPASKTVYTLKLRSYQGSAGSVALMGDYSATRIWAEPAY